MQEIKCPSCGKSFTLDEAGYADILKQVRDEQFEEQLHERLAQAEREKQLELQAAEAQAKESFAEKAKAKDVEIERLKGEIAATELAKKAAVAEALVEVQQERDALKSSLEKAALEAQISENKVKEDFVAKIKERDLEIERLTAYKLARTNNAIGDDLEKWCENEFNKIRAMSYPNAYFEKDTKVADGTKGDFVFRDFSDGVEYISIMFEMKNEKDTTATKTKNEHFFEKLDQDRKKKKCQIAVLVSMLEQDSDLYNTGIVNVSHKYPDMYVVRPEFFLQLIAIFCAGARGSVEGKKELALIKNQNIDITNFENALVTFQNEVERNYGIAVGAFDDAIEKIDKTITAMGKIKEELEKSKRQWGLTNRKTQDLSIRKLTTGNPTMKAKFDELKKSKPAGDDD